MIVCPAFGCRYFIGDQDFDTDQLRCTTMLGSWAFLVIKDASIQLTRQEESVRASTRDPVALYHTVGELRYGLTRPPGIVYGCEAYAGSRVLIIWTRRISTAMGDDALAGSQPVLRLELNTDGGLLPLRWEQVVVNTTGHDGQHYGAAAGRQRAPGAGGRSPLTPPMTPKLVHRDARGPCVTPLCY